MRSFAISAMTFVAAAKTLSSNEFTFVNYMATYGKSYSCLDEYNLGYERFHAIDLQIKELNATEKSFRPRS